MHRFLPPSSWSLHTLLSLLLAASWLVLLALLPWWLGLVLLLGLALGAAVYARRSVQYAEGCRRGLKWGLPGLLFAVQRAMGGDLLAWGAALLGALVGFSLVALLESLLFHRVQHRATATVQPEWSELALAPVGPAAHIIELQSIAWREANGVIVDPRGGTANYEAGSYRFTDRGFDRLSARYCFSPGGRWFAAQLPDGRGDVLWDRDAGKLHRLHGWHLYGWEGGQPWLSRQVDGMPVNLHEVLGML
ncbi:hypothetical protein [Dyella subtropica]|uniref:hypothetical protein n=1 Tax=Dyella subtropica TaxID=2992127 RepID=UPI0022593F05|nr:hypothetical protein [Dyella subtropica]